MKKKISVLSICAALVCISDLQGQVRLTDVATNGASSRSCFNASSNFDASIIAFRSDGDFLSEGRADNDLEIWLWSAAGLTRLTDATANSQTDRDADFPSISTEGDRVAFRSNGDYLSEGRGITSELWLWDESAGLARLTDVTTNGGTDRTVLYLAMSGDGTKIAFTSDADLLSSGHPDNRFDLWMWHEGSGISMLTDVADDTRGVADPAINSAGTHVAFLSDGDFLSEGRADNDFELWLWVSGSGLSRLTDVTAASATERDVANCQPTVSDDGSRIAFCSDADFLNEGRNDNDWEIWLWDQGSGLTRITDATANMGFDRDSFNAGISSDGSTIVFRSDADLLSEGIVDGQFEVWAYDIAGAAFTRISTSSDGANRATYSPTIDADGSHVVFSSDSEMGGETLSQGAFDLWVWPSVVLFTDGFENGDATRWSISVPAP